MRAFLTSACSIVSIQCITNIARAHKACIGICTILVASTIIGKALIDIWGEIVISDALVHKHSIGPPVQVLLSAVNA